MQSQDFRPDVTFEDTNVVGNVYFLNYLRWQNECRDAWLRKYHSDLFVEIFNDDMRLVVRDFSTRFHDALGAAIGDEVSVAMLVDSSDPRDCQFSTGITKISQSHRAPLASGQQRFVIRDRNEPCDPPSETMTPFPTGPAYSIDCPVGLSTSRHLCHLDVLELVRWQGLIRERFLVEFSPQAIECIATRSVALLTASIDLHVIADVRVAASDAVTVEMRLTHLMGGRMAVRFDYFLRNGNLCSGKPVWIATGRQSLACKHHTPSGLTPGVFPTSILQALREFTDSPFLQSNIDEAIAFGRDKTNPDYATLATPSRSTKVPLGS